MYELIIYGGASQKKVLSIKLNQEELNENLMTFLLNHKINIASSCNGEGVCQKCIIWQDEKSYLSCQIHLSEIFKNSLSQSFIVSYL